MAEKRVREMLPATLAGERPTAEALLSYEIFREIDPKSLQKFPGAIVRRRFNPGDVICREGEGGTTAFFIVEGTVRVSILQGRSSTQRRPEKNSLNKLLAFFAPKTTQAPTHNKGHLIPIDAGIDLTYGKPVGTLGAGEMFGEMSCLNLAPRSATVVAETPCVVFELLRNMYEVLQSSPKFRAMMDANYRTRALANHLRNIPIFEGLDIADEDIRKLQNAAQLIRKEPGTVIFNEGDDANDPETGGLYIVRLGQVKVTRKSAGGMRTMAYLSKGGVIGEMALLHKSRDPDGSTHFARRGSTCTAIDHPSLRVGRKRKAKEEWGKIETDLVRIPPDEFQALIEKYPLVRGRLELLAAARRKEDAEALSHASSTVYSNKVEELGLLQGQNLMLIDLTSCTRCDQCVDACVSAHDDGVTRLIRTGPQIDKYLVPASCRMCLDPVCLVGCPVGSIRRDKKLNIVIEDWCIGCGLCADNCPYDSIQMHPLTQLNIEAQGNAAKRVEGQNVVAVTDRAVVCDQCSDLPTGPACVYACPHDSAHRVNAHEFLSSHTSIGREQSP